eukprot:GDKJ01014148.1.p1 GENE.GDKJ01014148.1~~GDKJ01014148.1.p1  ORF type:complete len:284 (+),score=48.79 GDKJ01014148.1:79-852(+)
MENCISLSSTINPCVNIQDDADESCLPFITINSDTSPEELLPTRSFTSPQTSKKMSGIRQKSQEKRCSPSFKPNTISSCFSKDGQQQKLLYPDPSSGSLVHASKTTQPLSSMDFRSPLQPNHNHYKLSYLHRHELMNSSNYNQFSGSNALQKSASAVLLASRKSDQKSSSSILDEVSNVIGPTQKRLIYSTKAHVASISPGSESVRSPEKIVKVLEQSKGFGIPVKFTKSVAKAMMSYADPGRPVTAPRPGLMVKHS